jgi:DNA-binding MarR family transcriptional regulator
MPVWYRQLSVPYRYLEITVATQTILPTEDALDVVERATAVLARNFELVGRRTDIWAELDRSEYLLLRTLVEHGPADIRTVAAALGLDPSTAGRQVGGMQSKGLVERAPAEDDRRRSIITPTAQGRRAMRLTRGRRRTATKQLLGDWTDPDLRQLADLLSRYNQAVTTRYLL